MALWLSAFGSQDVEHYFVCCKARIDYTNCVQYYHGATAVCQSWRNSPEFREFNLLLIH